MRKKNKREHALGSMVIVILFLLIVFWQGMRIISDQQENSKIKTVEDISGCEVGMLAGASYSDAMEARFSDCTFVYYASYADMIEDVKAGRIDTYFADDPVALRQQAEAGNLRILDTLLTQDEYGFVLSLSNAQLQSELNAVLTEMKEDGTMEYLQEKWLADGSYQEPEEVTVENAVGTLKVATNADSAPFAYNYNGEITGYDIDVIRIAASRLGYEIETTQYAFGSLINSIVTGKEDIAVGGITNTEERSRSVLFTESVYVSGVAAVVLDPTENIDVIDRIQTSVTKTLINEDRWKQVMAGIGVTIAISVISIAAGTLFGIWFSVFHRSENRFVSTLFGGLRAILDTLPLMILLMFLYYVFFANTNISPVLVAIAGLTLAFTAAVTGVIQTGYRGIDPLQLEAAEAMGYKDREIFFKIAFPQITEQMSEQYLGACVSLIKDSAIVGYITVQDITNVLDTIRSSTYQAFFPILLTAFIYFVIAKVVIWALKKFIERFLKQKGGAEYDRYE